MNEEELAAGHMAATDCSTDKASCIMGEGAVYYLPTVQQQQEPTHVTALIEGAVYSTNQKDRDHDSTHLERGFCPPHTKIGS